MYHKIISTPLIFTSFANNNISPSRRTFQHSSFASSSRKNENEQTATSKEATNFSTPDVVLQNQSFLDALSARLSVGANPTPKLQPSSTKVQISNVEHNWNSHQATSGKPLSTIQRSPSFGSTKVDIGKIDGNTARSNAFGRANANANTFSGSNKNSIHTEIERGAFNLRKTNGILHDRSAPRL